MRLARGRTDRAPDPRWQGQAQGQSADRLTLLSAAVVTPDQIILAADVTTEANDVRQLSGMLNQARRTSRR
jgi:hypothetical protein